MKSAARAANPLNRGEVSRGYPYMGRFDARSEST